MMSKKAVENMLSCAIKVFGGKMSDSLRPPYDPWVIANWFIDRAKAEGLDKKMTNMFLQKMMFFAYGHYLANKGDEMALLKGYFEAWEHGPVHPAIYRLCKKYGRGPITERLQPTERIYPQANNANRELPKDVEDILSIVWIRLKNLSANQLRALSHVSGGAWDLTVKKSATGVANKNRITLDSIRDNFTKPLLVSSEGTIRR